MRTQTGHTVTISFYRRWAATNCLWTLGNFLKVYEIFIFIIVIADDLFVAICHLHVCSSTSSDITSGWPGLQIQVLQELVGTARRMGNSSLAVRWVHDAFCLLWRWISKMNALAHFYYNLISSIHSFDLFRHMTYLLHTMFDHISKSDRKDFASQLETLTSKCEGAPVILALEDTGIIIPPVNLISLPCVK